MTTDVLSYPAINPASPQYRDDYAWPQDFVTSGPSTLPRYLSPEETHTRPTRSASFASLPGSMASFSTQSEVSRSVSPNAGEMARWGYEVAEGDWKCSYQGCTSKSTFTRGCDLRKHYKRHTKSLFCRHEGCPQSMGGGFSSKKDRARHEAKHNPTISCELDDCPRLFSRVDNMKDHVRRVHKRSAVHQ
ncbi:hypothetical protein BAUCODRAFT_62639 [Baudoinia panamericana UAMH 10762]|uniref:C2H2-type domain-containing protein n=1 Tax=Baudoinia panamericana (strain UAMH 10762) TaxID=717646 RepID=M2NLH1_BAUPA|nr:uncharacterized protein BAUCODRAFT_62639 [Baudoinia panamericana UAMH 10762]EMD00340.1 hypothetical protein BAUCODRAFT_62639 [Baudoinia panamericana UAMH 10762]